MYINSMKAILKQLPKATDKFELYSAQRSTLKIEFENWQ